MTINGNFWFFGSQDTTTLRRTPQECKNIIVIIFFNLNFFISPTLGPVTSTTTRPVDRKCTLILK